MFSANPVLEKSLSPYYRPLARASHEQSRFSAGPAKQPRRRPAGLLTGRALRDAGAT